MAVLPFRAMCFMLLKGFVYTISVYFYAFHLAFSGTLTCVLQQNVRCLASKRTAFSGILHYNLLQTAPKQLQMAVACNKYSFCCIRRLTSFCNKTNLRENRLFAVGLAVGGKKS